MSMHSRRVRIWLVMIVATFALGSGLAACGGSSPASPTSSPTPSAERPQPSATGAPTPAPSRTPSPSPTPSPSRSSAAPNPSPSPSQPCPSDNALRSWYYVPNDAHCTPEVPNDAQRLLRTYGGHYVGDAGEKVVYLTFDEGYENGFTGRILVALQTAGVRAAFFVTGVYVRDNPELVRRMADEGHLAALPRRPLLVGTWADAACCGATGASPTARWRRRWCCGTLTEVPLHSANAGA